MSSSFIENKEHLIESDFLGETLSTRIYLPPNYSPLYTYPLVIAQDGQDYFNLGRIHLQVNQLIQDGLIEKIIVCGIPYSDIKTRWHRFHPSGEAHAAYLRFLHRELLPSLQTHFSVESLAGGVTLLGESLGATLSLIAAVNYPLTFGNVILQSPFVNEDLITLCVEQLPKTLHMYHSIGEKETQVKTSHGEIKNFLEPNQTLSKLLREKHLADYKYEEHTGDHTWRSWQGDLRKALLHFFQPSVR